MIGRRGALLTWILIVVNPSLIASDLVAQQTGDGSIVRGVVVGVGTNDGIPDVAIEIPGFGIRATTDEEGRFALEPVPPGNHTVHFASAFYQDREIEIEVVGESFTTLRVELAQEVVELDEVEVSVEPLSQRLLRSGFYERELYNSGRFLDLAEIEKRRSSQVSDLFRRVPGVRVIRSALTGDATITFTGTTALSGPCFPTVWLNGHIAHRGGSQAWPIDRMLSTAEVAGIEIYGKAAQIPLRFGGTGGRCGVVVIWTH